MIFSKEVKDSPGDAVSNRYKNVQCFYDAIADDRLYKCTNGDNR